MFTNHDQFSISSFAMRTASANIASARKILEQGKRERLSALIETIAKEHPSEVLWEHDLCTRFDLTRRQLRQFVRYNTHNYAVPPSMDIPNEKFSENVCEAHLHTFYSFPRDPISHEYVDLFSDLSLIPMKIRVMIVKCIRTITYYGADPASGIIDRTRKLTRKEIEYGWILVENK